MCAHTWPLLSDNPSVIHTVNQVCMTHLKEWLGETNNHTKHFRNVPILMHANFHTYTISEEIWLFVFDLNFDFSDKRSGLKIDWALLNIHSTNYPLRFTQKGAGLVFPLRLHVTKLALWKIGWTDFVKMSKNNVCLGNLVNFQPQLKILEQEPL